MIISKRAIKVRESKFGKALVIETMPQAGGYVLGFKIDPPDQLQEIAKQLQNIFTVFSKDPIFGVNVPPEDKVSFFIMI